MSNELVENLQKKAALQISYLVFRHKLDPQRSNLERALSGCAASSLNDSKTDIRVSQLADRIVLVSGNWKQGFVDQ